MNNVCKNCGARIDGKMEFCTHCGTKIPVIKVTQSTIMSKAEFLTSSETVLKRSKKIKILFGTVIVFQVILSFFGIYNCIMAHKYIQYTDTPEFFKLMYESVYGTFMLMSCFCSIFLLFRNSKNKETSFGIGAIFYFWLFESWALVNNFNLYMYIVDWKVPYIITLIIGIILYTIIIILNAKDKKEYKDYYLRNLQSVLQ